jgi:hypothetical protein
MFAARDQRNRAFDRLDNIRQRDCGSRTCQLETAADAAYGLEQPGGGQFADELLHGGNGQAGFIGQLLRRDTGTARTVLAAVARCGTHCNDSVVGHAGKTHHD